MMAPAGPTSKTPGSEKAQAHNLASTRIGFEVVFPDSIRRSCQSVDDVATFATAVDSAATITTLTKLGGPTDQLEDWVIQFLVTAR